MSKWSWLIVVALIASCDSSQNSAYDATAVSGWTIAPSGDLNSFFECLEEEGLSIVSAHRGGSYPGYPENALESMDALLAKVPAIMEIDVAGAADGMLFLMHDDTLERTTNGEGNASSRPWSAIKDLKLEDNDGSLTAFSPPRFDDVLAWARGRTILQIDFKRSARYEDVAAEIKRQNAEGRVILIAYSLGSAVKLHRLLPKTMISLSLNSQSALNRAVAAGIPADRLMGFTGTEEPRPRLFSMLNNRDVEVIFGTLGGRNSIDNRIERTGNETRYHEIAANGVDIIATDRPVEAYASMTKAGIAVSLQNPVCGIAKN